jgi:hypothetical protein
MNVIIPKTIADANFISSNISEPDTGEAFWLAATAYTLGQEVIRPNHMKYKNILAGTDAGLPENTPTRWKESGITNKWAAVDNIRNTQSARADSLVMRFAFSELIDSIGVVGLEGTDIKIELFLSGSSIYSYTQTLYKRNSINWFDWAFKPLRKIKSVVRLDLPIVANSEIVITVNNQGSIAKCGGVVIGKKQYIGKITYSSSGSALNFSTYDRNFDGTISTLIQRPSKPTVNAALQVEKAYVDDLLFAQTQLNAVPTIYTGLDDLNIDSYFELFLIMGIYKRFEIDATYPSHAVIQLELEEF